jgi:hypothetical protein
MYRLAVEYIELSSLRLVCTVVIFMVQENWSEAGQQRPNEAFIRYVHDFLPLSPFTSLNLGKEYYSVLLCSRSRWI